MMPFRVNDIGNYKEGINGLFDIVRIVNPISKKVIYQNGDGVYLVMASPIKFGDELYVLELLKDITQTGIVTGLSGFNIKRN